MSGSIKLLTIYANVGGTACVRVRHTGTYDVLKEVSGIGTEDALELSDMYAKCENCRKPCFIH